MSMLASIKIRERAPMITDLISPGPKKAVH